MNEKWWLLLKANPRSRREKRELQQTKRKVDSQLEEEPYDESRLNAFAANLARDHSVARRNVDIRRPKPEKKQQRSFWTGEVTQEYEPAEQYQAQPIKSKVFDEIAGSQQPKLTAHVLQQPRGGDEMDRYESINSLRHPLDPGYHSHGEGTPARLEAERVRRERGGY